MNPQYLLFVDFPLHSTHAVQQQYNSTESVLFDGTSSVLHPFVASASAEIIERLKSEHVGGATCEVSLVAYPTPSTVYNSYFHVPWRPLSKIIEFKPQAKPLPAQDPYDHFLELFSEIPSVARIEVIWLLHEDRLTSATSLSYRLSQTLRHLLDLKGVKTKIVTGPFLNVPHHFERVLSSLNIDIYPSAPYVPLGKNPLIRLQTHPHPYSASSARIDTNSPATHLELLSWSHSIPIAFQLIGSIQLSRIPLHIVDGQLQMALLHDSTSEDPQFWSTGIAHLIRPISRAPPTNHTFPAWKHEECHWEYPKTCFLPVEDVFVIYKGEKTILMRKLLMNGSGFSRWLSKPSKTFETPPISSNKPNTQWDFIQQNQDLDDFIAWIAKQAWISLNPDSPHIIDMTLGPTPQSLRIVAEWMQDTDPNQISSFLASCRKYAPQILHHMTQMETKNPGEDPKSPKSDELEKSMDIDVAPLDDDELPTMEISSQPFGDDEHFNMPLDAMSFNMDHIPQVPFPSLKPASLGAHTLLTLLHSSDRLQIYVIDSLHQLWNQVLARTTKFEPFTPGLASVARRRSLGRSSGAFNRDDMSVTSSDATSEPGQLLLDSVRKPGTPSSSAASNNPNKLKSSKQLRQELSTLSRPTRTSLSSVVSTIESKRRSSINTSPLSPLTSGKISLIPDLSPIQTAQPSSRIKKSPNPTNPANSLLLSPIKAKPLPRTQPLPSLTNMSFASHPSSSRSQGMAKPNKLPPLTAPSAKQASTPSQTTATTGANRKSASTDNQARLLACCKAEMSKLIKVTDDRFNELVRALFTVSKVIVSVNHDWNEKSVPNADLEKVVSTHSAQLLPDPNAL